MTSSGWSERSISRDVPQVLIPFDRREALTLREAADTSGFSIETVRRWATLNDIGRKVGGTWLVSRVALAMFLDSDKAALRAYLAGDRASGSVLAYYNRDGVWPEARDV
ncbi:helix-turn-helix domain-containing protein [uncultured Enterovirga sp.]|uniref:helix-turn-helix domain-containing protein n=1 Tax=uncultured Enterovirga sp. TaxID=2026352 RepID=UPI0035CBE1C1